MTTFAVEDCEKLKTFIVTTQLLAQPGHQTEVPKEKVKCTALSNQGSKKKNCAETVNDDCQQKRIAKRFEKAISLLKE